MGLSKPDLIPEINDRLVIAKDKEHFQALFQLVELCMKEDQRLHEASHDPASPLYGHRSIVLTPPKTFDIEYVISEAENFQNAQV